MSTTAENTLRTSIVSAGLLLAGSAQASEWQLDPAHTTVQFSVRHMMVAKVRGQFDQVSGALHLNDQDPARSMLEVVIDAASINTRNPQRDGHLKSPDFFDVANHPRLTFRSTRIEKAGTGRYKVTGDLTMRGVTRPVTLTVEGPTAPQKSPMGTMVRGVVATGKLNRKDWGLNWNKALEAGGVLVGDEVELQIDTELVAKAPAASASK